MVRDLVRHPVYMTFECDLEELTAQTCRRFLAPSSMIFDHYDFWCAESDLPTVIRPRALILGKDFSFAILSRL